MDRSFSLQINFCMMIHLSFSSLSGIHFCLYIKSVFEVYSSLHVALLISLKEKLNEGDHKYAETSYTTSGTTFYINLTGLKLV